MDHNIPILIVDAKSDLKISAGCLKGKQSALGFQIRKFSNCLKLDINSEIEKAKAALDAAVKHTLTEITSLPTGKASSGMGENLPIKVYGSTSKLRDISAITTPDAKTIHIQSWDKESVKAVEKQSWQKISDLLPL
jgi:hypothetical protein